MLIQSFSYYELSSPNEETIEIKVSSKHKKNFIEEELFQLKQFINKMGLSVPNIIVSVDLSLAEKNSKPFTDKEIYNAMVKKNPLISKLRSELGFDLE